MGVMKQHVSINPHHEAHHGSDASIVDCAGNEVEQKILAGPKNVKFNFINPTDPYHKYYMYKVLESKEGTDAAQAAFASEGAGVLTGKQAGAPASASQAAPVVEEVPKAPLVQPDDEKYTVHVPPGLTLQELDIIKLTAQYVARNGKEFLRGLRSREETKREFMFLKEAHSLNTFFKRLTDAYSSVLLDSKEALQRLNCDANDMSAILTRCEPTSVVFVALLAVSLHFVQSCRWEAPEEQITRTKDTVVCPTSRVLRWLILCKFTLTDLKIVPRVLERACKAAGV
jgi:hypothetical protein